MGKKGAVRIKQVGGPKPGQVAPMVNPLEEWMMNQQKNAFDPKEWSSSLSALPSSPPFKSLSSSSASNNNASAAASTAADRSFQVYWPLHETFSMDATKFKVIYPNYIDSRKTLKLGRRIAAVDAVDHPTVSEMSAALQQIGIRHVLQPCKGYSRDPRILYDNPGRVAFDPQQAAAVLQQQHATSTSTTLFLLKFIAQRIATLPSRIERLKQLQLEDMEYEQRKAAYDLSLRSSSQQQRHSSTMTTSTTMTSRSSAQQRKGKKGKR